MSSSRPWPQRPAEAQAGQASLGQLEKHRLPSRQVGDVPRAGQLVRDVLCGFQFAQLNQAIARSSKRVGDQLGGFGIALGRDDGCLLLLLGLRQRRQERPRSQLRALEAWLQPRRPRLGTFSGSRMDSGNLPPSVDGVDKHWLPSQSSPVLSHPLLITVGIHSVSCRNSCLISKSSLILIKI